MLKHRALFLGLMAVLVAGFALGSEAIPNWAAPASWSPSRSAGAHTLGDVTFMLPFIGVTPCRIWDTRGNGFTGQYGPPSIGANTQRTFTIAGQCGIPTTAQAVSFNIGALNVGGGGDLRVFPAGGGVPTVSTMNYNANTPNIANAAVVPLGAGGAITLQADATTIDSIGDVNGYYAPIPNGFNNGMLIENTNSGGPVLIGVNDSAAASSFGVEGLVSPTVAGAFSAGVRGVNNGTTGNGIGVWGSQAGGGWGVYGTATGSTGTGSRGVYGTSASTSNTASGVYGVASGTTGVVSGVYGTTSSATILAAGVRGIAASGEPAGASTCCSNLGVVGESVTGAGVAGVSQAYAGFFDGKDSTGSFVAGAFIGEPGVAGVNYSGGLTGSGTKNFVEPHPTDPTKMIRYTSLEGPEAGTYFRGTARTVNGVATILVPDTFRWVTDDDGLTVQLTPVGSAASMYIMSEDLNSIVIRSNRDVTFHYLVQGVRRAYKDQAVVTEDTHFHPRWPEFSIMGAVSPLERQRLIDNGTYNPDGTPNMTTAERVGWAATWKANAERSAKLAAERAKELKAVAPRD